MSRILLADDSPHAQRMGERILREEGYEVVTVTDGITALLRLPDVDPDVVFADVSLPNHSGYEICKRIKANPNHHHVRVILTAGLLETFDDVQAKDAHCDGILKKPFESSVVLETVKPLIAAAQKERSQPEATKATAAQTEPTPSKQPEEKIEASAAPAVKVEAPKPEAVKEAPIKPEAPVVETSRPAMARSVGSAFGEKAAQSVPVTSAISSFSKADSAISIGPTMRAVPVRIVTEPIGPDDAGIPLASLPANVDVERVRAAVTVALDAALPAIIDKITEQVLVALGH